MLDRLDGSRNLELALTLVYIAFIAAARWLFGENLVSAFQFLKDWALSQCEQMRLCRRERGSNPAGLGRAPFAWASVWILCR
jgi:hypothetical protein